VARVTTSGRLLARRGLRCRGRCSAGLGRGARPQVRGVRGARRALRCRGSAPRLAWRAGERSKGEGERGGGREEAVAAAASRQEALAH
jgi:hypothetical protein